MPQDLNRPLKTQARWWAARVRSSMCDAIAAVDRADYDRAEQLATQASGKASEMAAVFEYWKEKTSG